MIPRGWPLFSGFKLLGLSLLLPTTLALGALALGSCGADELESNGRAVILISIDSLRADHCSPYGYRAKFTDEATTPFMQRVAEEGVLFEQAVSPTSWTLPAHMSLLTGMHCQEHGVRNRTVRLDWNVELLSGRFKRAGYHTGGFYSAPFLHSVWGFDQGFDRYEPASPYLEGLDTAKQIVSSHRGSMHGLHNNSHNDVECSERVVDEALKWLQEGERYKESFFLFLHLWDPHYDYEPPQEYEQMFRPGYTGPIDGRGFMDARRRWNEKELDQFRALYDAEIRYTDDQIARLWSKIEAWGLADRVVLAITSDHGDEFYEHNQKGHQKTLFQEVVHIPMVVRGPGITAGSRVAQPVALYDLAPTLLDLAGVPVWSDRSGRSLRPAWQGAARRDPVLMDLEIPGQMARRMRGWRSGSEKLIWNARSNRSFYFDLENDPSEQKPLQVQSFPSNSAGTLAKQAFDRAKALNGFTAPMEESPEMTASLNELGYTEE